MKTQFTKNAKRISLGLCLGMLSLTGFAQEHVTLSLENITSTSNTIEYDLFIVNDGATSIKLSACSYGINYNGIILNGAQNSEGSFTMLPGSQAQTLAGLGAYSMKHTNTDKFNQVRLTMAPVREDVAPQLIKNVPYRVGHFKMTNAKAWTSNSNPAFALNEFNVPGITTSLAIGYINNGQRMISFSTTLKNLSVKIVNSPILNPSTTGQTQVSLNDAVRINDGQSLTNQNGRDAVNDISTSRINIYPNPTQDLINIDLNTAEVVNIHVKVLDIKGHIVKQIQAKSEKGTNNLSISLRDVADGLYTVQVYQNDKLSLVDKVTKKN